MGTANLYEYMLRNKLSTQAFKEDLKDSKIVDNINSITKIIQHSNSVLKDITATEGKALGSQHSWVSLEYRKKIITILSEYKKYSLEDRENICDLCDS